MAVVRTLAGLLALGAGLTSPLSAQQWPTRSIRIVTGTPAGGSPDFVSRLLAERLSERLGQAVVVENSATTGVAAWNTVAKSTPDGYLISMLPAGQRVRVQLWRDRQVRTVETVVGDWAEAQARYRAPAQ